MAPSSQQFRQAIAVVHHGERLDHTEGWAAHAASASHPAWRHDPPLSVAGKRKSRITGERLKSLTPDGASPYELIVASPELRCAQTASEIAHELGLPVLFDGDFVDVVSDLRGDRDHVHRSPQELVEALQGDYPDVQYAVDYKGQMQIVCGVPAADESLSDAASRYCHKVQFVVEASTLTHKSVIIVSHASAVATVAHKMNKNLRIIDVPPDGFFIATRTLKLKHGECPLDVTQHGKASMWNILLSAGITCDVRESTRRQLSRSDSCGILIQPSCEGLLEYHSLHRNIFEKDAPQFRRCRSISTLEFLLDGEDKIEPPVTTPSGTRQKARSKSSVEMLDSLLGTTFSDNMRSGRSHTFCLSPDIFQEDTVC
jgi:broad specificity phosphatase PhoE